MTVSNKLFSKISGVLFLAAFPLYGIGTSILEGSVSSTTSYPPHAKLGLCLVLANSIDVFTIGYLIQQIISSYDKVVANIYLSARILEASLLAVYSCALYVGVDPESPLQALYIIAMMGLAIGSLPLLRTLMSHKLIGSWLGWVGIIGYVCVFVGMVVDNLGHEDLSLIFMVPGALFEVTFGVWLIVRGFPESMYAMIS